MKVNITPVEQLLSTLEQVANTYDMDSVEYASVELSTKCALYIYMEGHVEAFNKYLESFHAELTNDQVKQIKEYKTKGSKNNGSE